MQGFKRVLLFPLLILSVFFTTSCKAFEVKEDIYFEVAKAFTEQTVAKLFDFKDFSFGLSGNVDASKQFTYTELAKVFGAKILKKITANGYAKLENERVLTEITWKDVGEGNYLIHYIRQVKDFGFGLNRPKTNSFIWGDIVDKMYNSHFILKYENEGMIARIGYIPLHGNKYSVNQVIIFKNNRLGMEMHRRKQISMCKT